MPTDRYLNLPEEKRRLINRAVVSDFRKNHYKDIKVGRIAGQVQLSRSSLYTYFDGKGEMLQLAVDQIWCDFFDFNKKRIVEHHADGRTGIFFTEERQNAAEFSDVFVQQ